MSRIDDLIAEECPEGVPRKQLSEVGSFKRGRRFVKDDMVGTGVPCIHYGEMYTHYGVWTKTVKSFLEPNKTKNLRFANPGDIIIVAAGETIEDIGNGVAWLGESDVVIHDACFAFAHNLEPKYVSYFLRTSDFRNQIRRFISSAKISSISAEGLGKATIPIPPLKVQREIVKVLDTFTQLEAELKTELEAEHEAHRRQYQYYRDALLSFEERMTSAGKQARWTTMGEIGNFFRGRRFTKVDYAPDGIECIHYGDVYTKYGTATTATVSHVRSDMASSLRFAKPGDLVIAGVGETVEDVGKAVAWLGDGEVAIHDDCFAFRHSLNPKFVSYYFQTAAFHGEKNKFVARGKLKRLSSENLGRLTIPVPPLDEQERIVAILDKFEALVNDLSNDLPAEIKSRRQQYEHYRDRLLSFTEAA
jgi:type I restriction enzyme, S subunit